MAYIGRAPTNGLSNANTSRGQYDRDCDWKLQYKGDGYYSRSDGFHTVQYNVTGFIGTIDAQASLADAPVEADWFNITTSQMISVDDSSTYNTGSFIYNFTGNYVWVRIKITNWTDGTINSILLNH